MNNQAKIDLKRTPERVELIKKMVDPDRNVAYEAQQAFAAYIRPAIQVVLNQKATANAVYKDLAFSRNDRWTIPLDLFVGTREKHITIWSQHTAGGLPTNFLHGISEYPFSVYRLDTAVSFPNDALKYSQLPILTAGIDRMINELVVKQERNAWAPLLNALAVATTNGNKHVISSEVAGVFQLADFNNLAIKLDRTYLSYASGTPESGVNGITDIFVSPEILGQIRSWAYNPMNTRGGFKSDGSEATSSVALPDDVRESIFRSGGLNEIYGINIHKLIELGIGGKYNTLFDSFYSGSPTFDSTTQEIVIGADLSRDVFLRPVITDDDNGGGSVLVRPDNQWAERAEKTGFYAKLEEGRIILDDRALVGIIV
jgi:hypothetical protein